MRARSPFNVGAQRWGSTLGFNVGTSVEASVGTLLSPVCDREDGKKEKSTAHKGTRGSHGRTAGANVEVIVGFARARRGQRWGPTLGSNVQVDRPALWGGERAGVRWALCGVRAALSNYFRRGGAALYSHSTRAVRTLAQQKLGGGGGGGGGSLTSSGVRACVAAEPFFAR